MGEKKKKGLGPLVKFTERAAAQLHRDEAASTVWLFSIGLDNKTWTGRTLWSALVLQSRREGLRPGLIRKGPVGCNLSELSPSTSQGLSIKRS